MSNQIKIDPTNQSNEEWLADYDAAEVYGGWHLTKEREALKEQDRSYLESLSAEVES